MTSPSGAPDREPDGPADAGTADGPAASGPRPSGVQGGPSAVLRGQPEFREPPEDYVKAAKAAPGHWLSVIDRHWTGDEGEPTPPWAILGRWRSDTEGDIVEWEENAEYRPSPDAHGWAPPVSPVDAAVQLVATGYASEDLFALMVADAEVAVCLDEVGGLAVTDAQDGTQAVPVFPASPALDQDRLPPHEMMLVPDLLDRLPEGKEVLVLSSSAPVGQLVTASALLAAQAELEEFARLEEADAWPPGPTAGDGSEAASRPPGSAGERPEFFRGES
ncbi:type VII secretion system-associated protein [Streptomyces sp. NPDC102283]|uniref:type VII secretion system-associated protein n=1 Tax=Streptomyces sp. NPDC102283 TaxID=3366155 RepID=UPI00382261F5